jgi:hypothetical protein
MALKVTRMAVAFLLGIILAAHPVVAISGAPPAAKPCCCKGGHCCGRACCAASKDTSAPVTPVPVPSNSQNEFQALPASIISLLTLPSLPANEYPSRFSSLVPITAIPLFQRDCCYLI